MSSEVYLGEVDCRRIESLQCAVESLTAALVDSRPIKESQVHFAQQLKERQLQSKPASV